MTSDQTKASLTPFSFIKKTPNQVSIIFAANEYFCASRKDRMLIGHSDRVGWRSWVGAFWLAPQHPFRSPEKKENISPFPLTENPFRSLGPSRYFFFRFGLHRARVSICRTLLSVDSVHPACWCYFHSCRPMSICLHPCPFTGRTPPPPTPFSPQANAPTDAGPAPAVRFIGSTSAAASFFFIDSTEPESHVGFPSSSIGRLLSPGGGRGDNKGGAPGRCLDLLLH